MVIDCWIMCNDPAGGAAQFIQVYLLLRCKAACCRTPELMKAVIALQGKLDAVVSKVLPLCMQKEYEANDRQAGRWKNAHLRQNYVPIWGGWTVGSSFLPGPAKSSSSTETRRRIKSARVFDVELPMASSINAQEAAEQAIYLKDRCLKRKPKSEFVDKQNQAGWWRGQDVSVNHVEQQYASLPAALYCRMQNLF